MARLKPPSLSPQIDPRWLALGLRAAWPFNERAGGPKDALNGYLATLDSSGWGSGAQGPVIVHDATTDRTELAADSSVWLPAADVTIVIGVEKTDGTNRDSGAFGVNTATAAEYCAAMVPAADGTVYWDYGGVTAGTTRLTAAGLTFGQDTWAFTAGPRGMEIWQNGQLRASNAANPTRTPSSAALKLGLYDSGLGGDLAKFNSFYVFASQLSPDDIALLTSDPSQLFVPPHLTSKFAVEIAAQQAGAQNVATLAVIRIGRQIRGHRTQTPGRAFKYLYTDSRHSLEQGSLPTYGYLDTQHALANVELVYGYADTEHALGIFGPRYSYADSAHDLKGYAPPYAYLDASHTLNAGTLHQGALDAQHALNAFAVSYGFSDAEHALNVFAQSYGFGDAQHAFNAYTSAYGFSDAQHAFNAYAALYGFTDGRHALNIPGLPLYGFTDAQHRLDIRSLWRGALDLQHALTPYTSSYGFTDSQHALLAYAVHYGYGDAQHALDAYARLYGYLDAQHLLDAAAAFYGWVLNQTTGAASRYEGFDFNSMSEAGGRYLAATSTGIHELGGADDAGTAISAFVLSGDLDFGSEKMKRVTDLYVGGDASGALAIEVRADDTPANYTLPAGLAWIKNRKTHLGRGAKGRYWRLEVANVNGGAFEIDDITLLPVVLQRRV